MNSGKRFEKNFKDSVPKDVYIYRFKDGSASWDGGDKVRFQHKNICDYMLYKKPNLFLLELKSTKGISLPNQNVKEHQIEELIEASKHKGTVCGLLIEFSDHNAVYFIEINAYRGFLDNSQRKSLPMSYLAERGVKIEIRTLKKNIRINVKKMIGDILNVQV